MGMQMRDRESGSSRMQPEESLLVVAIGASAGGIDALTAFFSSLPADSGLTFIVMMHLSPDAESFLPDILSRIGSVPIVLAADGLALERNRVYIVPPGTVASVSGQCIRLRTAQREPRERNPIDVLFVSLAHDLRERAVGVVLSGTGSDGSAGVTAIKKCGGLTVAQGANDSMPQFGDMPENAIATGSVDWVVPVEQMPERLAQYHRHSRDVRARAREYLVFSDVGGAQVKSATAADGAGEQAVAGVVETLERDLRETEERLQSAVEEGETTIGELKSANEEMLSVNEELQSSNEELETAKEEMQSLNEELHAMNLELTRRVEELDQANSDLRNVLDSTQVAMIFLDQSLVIRSYTRPVVGLFNLISTDRGRPLTDISHQLIYEELSADLSAVLSGATPIERHVRHRTTGAYYLLRILPYRSEQQVIVGLLLVLVDITVLKTSEEQQHRLVGELNHRVRNMLGMVTSLAVQTFGTRIKEPVFQAFLDRVQAVARTYQLVTEAQWRSLPLRTLIEVELEAHAPGPDRVQISGPDVILTPRAALSLGMVAHELATNAVKYGAFCSSTGTVEISWSLIEASAHRNLEVRWVEKGSVAGGGKHVGGFGTRLIEEQIRYELGGTAVRSFAPSGLSATFIIPARHLASVNGIPVTT